MRQQLNKLVCESASQPVSYLLSYPCGTKISDWTTIHYELLNVEFQIGHLKCWKIGMTNHEKCWKFFFSKNDILTLTIFINSYIFLYHFLPFSYNIPLYIQSLILNFNIIYFYYVLPLLSSHFSLIIYSSMIFIFITLF